MMCRLPGALRALLLAALASAGPSQAVAQQIILDRPVKAGVLTLFPDLNDTLAYYYVPDQARLATDSNGQPEFSFLRYVENQRSGADQPELREGEGGGIVHAVVALAVSDEQLRDARTALRRVVSGARIVGPVLYHSGKFALITSFKDPQGNLARQVVGLGTAPLLDGEKAAVSIQLTKLGAILLWQSFHTTTPDITFSFEMELQGFRLPHRAVIEANFDQIYEHEKFAAGFASTYLAAEIQAAFDDLRRQGAIKLTEVGSDESLNQLITTAYNKLTEMMFQPLGSAIGSDLAPAGSLLDRATAMLDKNQKAVRDRNAATASDGATGGATPATTGPSAGTPKPDSGKAADTTRAHPAGSTTGKKPATSGGKPATKATGGNAPAGSFGASAPTQPGTHADVAKPGDPPSNGSAGKSKETVPSFAVVATFEMKRVHQQGIFKIDLNKYTTDNVTLRFDQNIGDLSALLNDTRHFRDVNTADPLYQQRELVVFLDGLNASDFGQYVNFVTVHLKKQHGGGAITEDEVRIDRTNFNKAGNNFKLLYGWQGDTDRSRWMEYDYELLWSFNGGHTVSEPWRHASAGAITATPPYQRRVVDLEADPAAITAAKVRAITAKVFYDLGAGEQVRQVTLNATKGQLSSSVEFMLPADRYDYGYQLLWRLQGGSVVDSGRRTASDAVLFVDDLPPHP